MASQPKSLLQLAGAPLHPSPLEKSVLVIIDAQNEYVGGGLPLVGVEEAIGEIRSLLALARRQAVPVLHVVHHAARGSALFNPDGPFAAIVPELTPVEGEAVVAKSLPNAFAGTDLDARIRDTGRSEIILTGFMTHMCVSATARVALDLRYRTTVVAKATATRDLPDPTGGMVTADAVQRANLAALADRFAIVVPDAEALSAG